MASWNFERMKGINKQYFQEYSNGGYGKIPNPIFDDSITTDEVLARTMQQPELGKKNARFNDYKKSDFYQYDRNRARTGAKEYYALQQKGFRLLGLDAFGKYNVMASQPDPSHSTYLQVTPSSDTMTQGLLWVVLGVGFLVLISNALAPAPLLL